MIESTQYLDKCKCGAMVVMQEILKEGCVLYQIKCPKCDFLMTSLAPMPKDAGKREILIAMEFARVRCWTTWNKRARGVES